MTSHTRISAIITTFNYGQFLPDAIDSVLRQTRAVDEIVVVDDGSTDDTASIVAAYAGRGVRYVYQENQGAGAARNRGIQETSGNLICFLDADDMWLPEKTGRQEAYLRDHHACLLVSGQKLWWDVRRDRKTVERYGDISRKQLRRDILVTNVVGNPSMVLVRRDAVNRAGEFDASLRWGQDWEFFIRVSRAGDIGFLKDPVVIYRWHPTNLSHDRRWERLGVIEGISRRAIAAHDSAWQRVVLRLRLGSAIEFDRARLSLSLGLPRWRRVMHAQLGLLLFPFENTASKGALAIRSILGETVYQRVHARMRPGLSDARDGAISG